MFAIFADTRLRVLKFKVPLILIEVAEIDAALSDVTLVVERLLVPVTFKFVPKIDAALSVVTFIVERLEVDETLRVVDVINGMAKVSKLNTVLAALDVNPAVKRLVVVTEFAEYRLEKAPVFAPATAP